jgi:hypothetical protein
MADKKAESKLKEYIAEIYEDTQLTDFSIKDTQLKLPAIKHKYVSRLIAHKKRLSELRIKKEKQKRKIAVDIKKTSVYSIAQSVAEKTAEGHNTIQSINAQITEEELIIKLLEKTERTFNSMTYDIKNIIELMKLEVT